MKKNLVRLLIALLSLGLKSSTACNSAAADSFEIHRVLIITYQAKMFRSDITGPSNSQSAVNSSEFRKLLQGAFPVALSQVLPGWWQNEIMQVKDSLHLLELVDISVVYNYRLIYKKNKPGKKDESEQKTEVISEGQIVSPSDDRPKFMDVDVKNDSLLNFLHRVFKSDYILFLNEFDIIIDKESNNGGMDSYPKNRAIVHFTLFNEAKKKVVAGTSYVEIPIIECEQSKIIEKFLPLLAKDLASQLPGPIPIKRVKKGR